MTGTILWRVTWGETMTAEFELTPTQRRIMEILSDGLNHSPLEIAGMIDGEAEVKNIAQHIYNIRIRIKRDGYDIVYRNRSYRLVTLITNPLNLSGRRAVQ